MIQRAACCLIARILHPILHLQRGDGVFEGFAVDPAVFVGEGDEAVDGFCSSLDVELLVAAGGAAARLARLGRLRCRN